MVEARRNKRYGRDCADFERNWAPLLVRMMRELQEKTFRVDHNYAFLTSIPKWREIFATSFAGRIADICCATRWHPISPTSCIRAPSTTARVWEVRRPSTR